MCKRGSPLVLSREIALCRDPTAVHTSAAHALVGAKLRGPVAGADGAWYPAVTLLVNGGVYGHRLTGSTMETVPPRVHRGEAPAAPSVTA